MNPRIAVIEKASLETAGMTPQWWHPHGFKMKIRKTRKGANQFVITGSAASLIITPTIAVQKNCGEWAVDWRIIRNAANDEMVCGRCLFGHEELKAAFGLSDEVGKAGQSLCNRFGGHSAEPGKYIRFGNYLNIPCPGCGCDGDPNVSIYIDSEMRIAIRRFIT